MNIFNLLHSSAQNWGDRSAIIHNDQVIDYDNLLKVSTHLKDALVLNGLTQGLAVSIIFPNSIDFVVSLMAAVGTGATVMPIYHHQKESEIVDAIENGQIHFVLSQTDNEILNENSASKIRIKIKGNTYFLYKTNRDINTKTAAFIENPAFMRFTSGTTGRAKGVLISHENVIERIDSANEDLQLNETDTVLWVLPMAFHFVVSIVLFLKYGTTIVINDGFLAQDMVSNIKKNKVSFLYGSPMHIKVLSTHMEKVSLPSLQKVISTTTSISSGICDAFYNKYKISVSQAYGIIEIGLPIINTKKSEDNPEAVGFCLPAYRVGILDENHNELPDDSIGILGIKGPGMFGGYLTPPMTKDEILTNGWFLTGDYAIRNSEGLITIKGRQKSVINVSGNKVFPNEVEEVINGYPGILKSQAYSKNHLLLGEIVALRVMIEEDADVDQEELINYSRKYLSDFKIPQVVDFVNHIEMTSSGKIKRDSI